MTGKGVTGKVGGRTVTLGNTKLMADQGIALADLAGQGATALFVGVNGRPGGIIAIADPIKATSGLPMLRKRRKVNESAQAE